MPVYLVPYVAVDERGLPVFDRAFLDGPDEVTVTTVQGWEKRILESSPVLASAISVRGFQRLGAG